MQDNKQYILILGALLVLGGLGFYFVSNNSSDKDDSMMEKAENTVMMEDESLEDDKMMDDDKMAEIDSMMEDTTMEAPEGAVSYMISEGSASYVVQKGWVSKPSEEVVGTTSDVSGSGWINPETGALYLNAKVDLSSLKSSSEDRDEDIQKRFDDPTAMLVLELDSSTIAMGEPFELETPVMLTVNGVEAEVPFAMSGTVTEEGFTATGTAKAKISDFGMEAPSVLGLYVVDDNFQLTFDVTGTVK